MTATKVTRQELYDQVWKTPMRRLAAEYGVSDVALAKTCRRLGVPRPGRGYWAQLAAGAPVRRPALPKPKAGQDARTFLERVANPTLRTPGPRAPTVPVSEKLEDAHEAVRALGRLLLQARPDPHGRLIVSAGSYPLLAVTLATHRRALLVLDGLCKVMVARGHRVSLDKARGSGGAGRLVLSVKDIRVEASMVERLDRRERAATEEEKRRFAYRDKAQIFYEEFASGRLQLVLHGTSGPRSSWSDGAKHRLEGVLGRAVLAAENEVEATRLRLEVEERARIEAKRRMEEEQERQRQAREREQRARYEEALAKDLRQVAQHWRIAADIRAFLDAVARRIPEGERDQSFAAWLAWATSYAATMDPLTDVSAFLRVARAG